MFMLAGSLCRLQAISPGGASSLTVSDDGAAYLHKAEMVRK